jgi:hypothetical protein
MEVGAIDSVPMLSGAIVAPPGADEAAVEGRVVALPPPAHALTRISPTTDKPNLEAFMRSPAGGQSCGKHGDRELVRSQRYAQEIGGRTT